MYDDADNGDDTDFDDGDSDSDHDSGNYDSDDDDDDDDDDCGGLPAHSNEPSRRLKDQKARHQLFNSSILYL